MQTVVADNGWFVARRVHTEAGPIIDNLDNPEIGRAGTRRRSFGHRISTVWRELGMCVAAAQPLRGL